MNGPLEISKVLMIAWLFFGQGVLIISGIYREPWQQPAFVAAVNIVLIPILIYVGHGIDDWKCWGPMFGGTCTPKPDDFYSGAFFAGITAVLALIETVQLRNLQ